MHDILKEQDLSDKFFDDKISYLLGFKNETDSKIYDNNLLNFYLSSITIKNFEYQPTKKTAKSIWEYLNAANLIKLEDIENKEKIKDLELAANENTLEKLKIFEIYKRVPFELNTLIKAEDLYQTFDEIEARALIYQKYLLSDNIENKVRLLFLLKDLFAKGSLANIYKKFLSDELKELKNEKIPDKYAEIIERNIIEDIEFKLGKIKFDDKILHRSRIVRYFTEGDSPKKKYQKDFDNIYKKIKKNRNYFFSAKDLALVESLKNDGFVIPKDIDLMEIRKKYNIPSNLQQMAKNQNSGYVALKIVEIIGEDEIYNLDPETIYFIINLLNSLGLEKIRNEIITSALPLRT